MTTLVRNYNIIHFNQLIFHFLIRLNFHSMLFKIKVIYLHINLLLNIRS